MNPNKINTSRVDRKPIVNSRKLSRDIVVYDIDYDLLLRQLQLFIDQLDRKIPHNPSQDGWVTDSKFH